MMDVSSPKTRALMQSLDRMQRQTGAGQGRSRDSRRHKRRKIPNQSRTKSRYVLPLRMELRPENRKVSGRTHRRNLQRGQDGRRRSTAYEDGGKPALRIQAA